MTHQIGVHCILEVNGCPFQLLDNEAFLRQLLDDASRTALSTLLNITSHRFEPHGVTALALLAESHISIHTWPESGYAAIDIFTCGDHAQPKVACDFMIKTLKAQEYTLKVVPRGNVMNEYHPAVAACREDVECLVLD